MISRRTALISIALAACTHRTEGPMMRFNRRRRRQVAASDPVFDVFDVNLNGHWRANYIGGSWAGSDTDAGLSGSHDLLSSANNPAVGASLNGLTPADFNGTTHRINDQAARFLDVYLSAATWWIGCLVKADSAAANGAAFYDDAALVGEQNGGWGVSIAAGGVRACNYDGGYDITPNRLAVGTDWAWVEAWLSGGVLSCSVNGGTADTVTSGNLTVPSARQLRLGANYNNTVFFNGQMAEVMIADVVPSADDRTSIRESYILDRYGLTL